VNFHAAQTPIVYSNSNTTARLHTTHHDSNCLTYATLLASLLGTNNDPNLIHHLRLLITMAPTRQKKRKSTESTSFVDVVEFPAPPQLVPAKLRSPTKTPTNKSPIRKARIGITAGQKQALIDNLQLESKNTMILGETRRMLCLTFL